ncbi:cytochrome ubiquinol oxidase subunit II [Microbulbifer sp. TYP-18]|uniref:cytochrome ubiquinol oxidase subunit II n=1 Tax=Microbulbifer sp. TYP-18 TaxID=3230024 RepID=UPI0034C5D0B7
MKTEIFYLKVLRDRVPIVCWVAAVALLTSGCGSDAQSFLDPKGPIAEAQKSHFIRVIWLSMLAAGPVFLLVPLMLWRYRYKNKRASYTPNWEFSARLDAVMWGIPFLIIFSLSVQLWHSTKALDPYRPIDPERTPLDIQVVGLDWKWLFIYPEYGVASIGEMAFPVGTPVSLVLTSDTVMQSFLISPLAGQIYTMPGMQTKLYIKADAVGVFEGENTQFNGDGFAGQKFKAIALSNHEFESWIENARSVGVRLDKTTYARLAQRSSKAQVHQVFANAQMPEGITYFNRINRGLYQSVIDRYHTGENIPMTEQPGGVLYRVPAPPDTTPQLHK